MNTRVCARPAAWLALLLVLPLLAGAAETARERWNYLPADDIGAVDFRSDHPGWDGRGVVVAILDTGVDPHAPGLGETSTGQTKLIDARDFSGEGRWDVMEAELADTPAPGSTGAAAAPGAVWVHESGLRLRGGDALPVPPAAGDGAQPVYIGVIAERAFVNIGDLEDLNDDGDTSDRFGFLVYTAARAAVEEALGVGRGHELLGGLNETARTAVERERRSDRVWLVVVDTDGDGDLAGEALLRDYRVNHDSFTLVDPSAPDARPLMSWQVNVTAGKGPLGEPEAPEVEFHYDSGSHGSHCAGIAAGHGVSGQPGLDGVAPGAWLISCKLGDNRLAGGATRTGSMKKAYEYAAEFGERYGLPVVVNMSFGINSVEEGEDTMGTWLDEFLAEHPSLVVCTSAGNEGPGLSTIGIPATSASVISSGAYLSPATGRDLYNAQLQRETLFAFSSRGGETGKPDIVAPGSALSTVPGFVDGSARFNGTSMASPQTAGAVACFMSGAADEGLTVHWGMVKRALIAGARTIEGLTVNDQGGGLVAMEPTWRILRELARSESAHQVLDWRLETACPLQHDGKSDAAYWRTPGGTPVAPEVVTFTVSPVFHPDLTPEQKDTFFRSFSLRSEADWLKIMAGNRYVRGDMAMEVVLQYDGRRLEEPGEHAARVIGSLDGGDLSGLAAREFYLRNTVVVGEPTGPQPGYARTWRGDALPASWVRSHYVDVPSGASAMRVRLECSEAIGAGRGARVIAEICDPEGHVQGGWTGYAAPDGEQVKDTVILRPALYTGTWEINIASAITARDPSPYRLSVSFDGYDAPEAVTELKRRAAGEDARTTFTVTRSLPGAFRGSAEASMDGFRRQRTVEVEETDEWTHTFKLDRETPRARFRLTMEKEFGNLFTDCAVNILDSDGKAVTATGFGGLAVEVGTRLPDGEDSATFTLQVVGAFALPQDMAAWGFELEETYQFASAVSGAVKRDGGGALELYAGVPTEVRVAFADSWPTAPDGLHPYGKVRFLDRNYDDRVPGDTAGRLVLEVPIRLE
ncbi:MAG: S8 family serine peptidase [Candidatus Krumholzibacteriia bacterium]